jgi:hypothetical protein
MRRITVLDFIRAAKVGERKKCLAIIYNGLTFASQIAK